MMQIEQILTIGFVAETLISAVRLATPLLLAATGETLSRRTGIINLGLEGILSICAFSSFLIVFLTGNLFLGIFLSGVIGAIFASLHSFISVALKENQVISGLALALLGVSLSSFLFLAIFGVRDVPPQTLVLSEVPIPFLSDIPFIGEIFFNQSPLTYASYIAAIATFILIFHTHIGIQFTACGENPVAAETAGINVSRLQYIATLFCGFLTGIGGAYLTASLGLFRENMVSGRGWIAFALVTFSGANPLGAAVASLLFGAGDAIQLRMQAIGVPIPYQFLLMTPYLLTVIAMILSSLRMKMKGLR